MKKYFSCLAPAALATLATMPAAAEELTLEQLTKLENKIEVGIAGIGDESRRMGMYNGMSGSGGVYPIFDASIINRDEQTGTWFKLDGEGLGAEGGKIHFSREKQGAWNYFIEGGRTTYANPRVINTGLNGLGTTLNTTGGARRDVDFDMHRDNLKLGGGMRFMDNFKFDVSAREEHKTGMRQWGMQGFNFAAEPIDFHTQEYQANLSYTGKQLQMQGGYLGSIFSNSNTVFNSVSTSENTVSLPLSNMMHQLYLNGGYSFTPSTRGTFNASYGRMTQNEDFFTQAGKRAGNTRTDLGGKVDNTLLNLGLSSRISSDLSARVKARYEERNDNTPLAQYVSATSGRNGYNVPFSRATTTADAEATYKLPMQFKLIGGAGFEHWERSSPPIRHAGFSKEVDEATIRLTLRRPLLETLSGSIGYAHSERNASEQQGVSSTMTTSLNNPILWADRSRDKARVTLEWAPISKFSMQFLGEASRDNYTDDRYMGPQDGSAYFASLDANYRFLNDWDVTGWISINETSIEQRSRISSATGMPAGSNNSFWEARLRHIGKAAGVNLKGKVSDNVKVAADLTRSEDTSVHGINNLTNSVYLAPLPDIEYRQWLLALTGDYALEENRGVKLKYGLSHTQARDWTWQNFTYADGTTVKIPDSEIAHFVGLSFYYRW